MQLTRQTDFAIRVMMFLGIQEKGKLVTINDIAEYFSISRNHLMKIVHKLGRLEYIETLRGKKGGLRILRNPDDVNLGQLIRDFETTLEFIDCAKLECPIQTACNLVPIMQRAQMAFLEVVDSYTLTDLLTNSAELSYLLGVEPSKESQSLAIEITAENLG